MNVNILEQLLPKKEGKEITKENQYQSKDNLLKYPNLRIGIIIPAFNEELNIEKVLSKIPKNISEELDVLVVDDGSTDKTCEIAKSFNTILFSHEGNYGNGAATRTGLNYCKKKNYDIVIILDGDGQHNPDYIFDFINPIVVDNCDFVIGNRFKYYYEMNPYKKLCSKMLTAFYFVFLRKKISDPTNGYRALSSRLLNNLELESDYSITQEMLFKILPYYKYKEIPIKVNQRESGQSFIKLKNYFFRMILFFIKYYIFPKIRKIIEYVFNEDIRKMIGHMILKT